MAFTLTKALLAAALAVLPLSLRAQPVETETPETLDMALSQECRVPGGRLYALAPLRAVRAVVEEKRPLKVLALGSAGATMSASSGSSPGTYSLRLEGELQKALPEISVIVNQRELSGDITAQASERISGLVAEVQPDLLVWQVGVSDALAKADLDAFSSALKEVLEWLWSHNIDVVLVEPPYSAPLSNDEHYNALMRAIQTSAQDNRVPLVLRFEAMEFLNQQRRGRSRMSAFQLSDLGAGCIAEHVGRTIALSLLQTPASGNADSKDDERSGRAQKQ